MNFQDELMHHGTPHEGMIPHSGRYPYGSGENGGDPSIRAQVKELRAKGVSEVEIAQRLGMKSTKELREAITIEKNEQRQADTARVLRMKDHGYSIKEISNITGITQSTVRNYLNPILQERVEKTNNVINVLRDRADKKKYVDVGKGTEIYLGISEQRLNASIKALKDEGYLIHYLTIEQAGNPGKFTTVKVLTPPGVPYSDVYKHRFDVKMIEDYRFEDDGKTGRNIYPPKSIDSSRIKINYAETGGTDKDGVIELRRGVEDISLGEAQYAQVRIAVDGTHYLKGMAVYSDDIPKGYDIVFNTNKHEGTPVLGEKDNSVLKPLKRDKNGNVDSQNPFGATIKDVLDDDSDVFAGGQRFYKDKNGKTQQSVINKVKNEGDWEAWKKTLSSQFLSKQNVPLIQKQLNLTYQDKVAEYEVIKSLTNPTIKRKLLQSFADDCDSAAVKLKAVSLPRQTFQVILPVKTLKDTEIYAPNYRQGEQVALVRYPHGGTFEIPLLTVNNRHKDAKNIIGGARDAVGINSKVAERLSGADFDGDTVMVIPTSSTKVRTSPPLEGLKNFEPKEMYRGYEGMKRMNNTQKEMGVITNLIADMTLKGATDKELARAVRHSMVVIDAEKHYLNYKQSYEDNAIDALKRKYQPHANDKGYGGASTLITRAKSEQRVDERRDRYSIDPKTGEKIFLYTGRTHKNKKGDIVNNQTISTKMYETSDAYSLVSDMENKKEIEYAKYANKMKALGNEARKELTTTKALEYSPSARKTYAEEVSSLNSKLNIALKNAPRERQAQMIANKNIAAQKKANPEMDKDDLKKLRNQSLAYGRTKAGAGKESIPITDREWEAIQAGAIHDSKLSKILDNTDLDALKKRAMPRTKKGIPDSKLALARAMKNNGYTMAEIADIVGVSTSTLYKAL